MNRLQEGFVLGDRYRLESRIASGGMADVWRGTDDVLQRHVAVKIMRPDTDHERLFALRFRDEAVHSAALMHTNIATVFDYGEDDGLAFLVMELVEGEPLSAILNKRGPLPPHEVRSIMGQAALALGVAHEARVVHRDIKPANIMVREDGLVKLTDFGIARALDASGHTQHGEMLGTPNYISPEQALGHAATGASDLYALGVVAHEMLVGQRPFDRGTPIATALSHVNEPPPPLPDTVPEDLRDLITECLEKDPEQRPANAASVAVRLGMGDQELRGLALGLATAINGSPADMIENVEELAEEVAHNTGAAVGSAGATEAPKHDARPTGSATDDDGLEPTRAMATPTSTPLPSEREDTARGA
ncbi:serine/threonine-protein kinase [Terrabacter koreensis]|jgi:serine/threonine-protein kinase